MPLFRAAGEHGGAKARPRRGRRRRRRARVSGEEAGVDGCVPSLTRLCLLSLADNMKEVWAKDYAEKYLDQYSFRHIMGPFNLLPAELVEELTWLLCSRRCLSRPALHLLLVPQLRGLSLEKCPSLVTSALCAHIAARCQGLWSLDLSGAQQLPSKALSGTLCSLPALRSLCLAGGSCDGGVIWTIARHCRLLRHLDVSRCHSLSPAALLPLGGGALCPFLTGPPGSSVHRTSTPQAPVSSSPSSSSPSSLPAPLYPLPLTSLLALDAGFGEQEGDCVAAAAYLLLSLPLLERAALEGLGQACRLIESSEFSQTEEFTDREGAPRLTEVWRERRHRGGVDGWRKKGGATAGECEDEEEERALWEGCGSESDEGQMCSLSGADEKRRPLGDEHLNLRLKDVKGLTCDSLDSIGRLCPDICSICVNADDDEDVIGRLQWSLLAAGLQAWSGQLQTLSVHFPGPLVELLSALQVTGSSLVSLTLEGVKTGPGSPLLEVLQACPRLTDLSISAEPPAISEGEEEGVDQREDQDLPRLSNLRSLTLNFSYNHNQMKPAMSWLSLKRGLRCLLAGSPLLDKLSLVSLPCPLNCILQEVLRAGDSALYREAGSTDQPPVPLGLVQHVDLLWTDVKMITVKNMMQRSRRLTFVDLSYCWQISQLEWLECQMSSKVQVVWV